MTPDEYYRQERDRVWKLHLAGVTEGRHPSLEEIAGAIYELGLEPHSPAARYIGMRLIGDLKVPRGNSGRPRKKKGPDKEWMRWLYDRHLEDLQILLASDEKAYRKKHFKTAPHDVAIQLLADEYSLEADTVRKAVYSRG
ncbi:MAG: hypothetical protein M3P26_12395 [Gemmatimonadota bacterium]|nr:hypothetical protein [Gemmatimonadota bacterium]